MTLLASTSATLADATGETFQSIPVGPVDVSGGFFVAVLMTYASGEWPAALDQGASQGASWAGGAGAGMLSAVDPVGTSSTVPVNLVDNVGYPGNWTVRALGESTRAGIPALGTIGFGVFVLLLCALGWSALHRLS